MLKVHHLNNSRSQRILWLLEELALPYEIIEYQRARLLHGLQHLPNLARFLERGGPYAFG